MHLFSVFYCCHDNILKNYLQIQVIVLFTGISFSTHCQYPALIPEFESPAAVNNTVRISDTCRRCWPQTDPLPYRKVHRSAWLSENVRGQMRFPSHRKNSGHSNNLAVLQIQRIYPVPMAPSMSVGSVE